MPCQRLFNGRLQNSPELKHIVIDRYDHLVLLTTYHCADFDREWVDSFLHQDDTHLLWRERDRSTTHWHYLQGEPLTELICEEGGLHYKIKLGESQNVGLFLDMAHLREHLQNSYAGKSVLNLFAYTCSLSMAALRGGATQVTNVDMKSTFLNWGKENHQLSQLDLSRVSFLKHNILKSLNNYIKRGPFDLVIIDPPTFQPGGFKLKKDYSRILKKLPKMLALGGEAIICSNDPLQSMEEFYHLISETLAVEHLEKQPFGVTPNFDGPKMIRYTP